MALFNKTARQWRDENPKSEGNNIRDQATIEQLLVLANIESMNAEFIRMALPQPERLLKLNQIAIVQLKSLTGNPNVKAEIAWLNPKLSEYKQNFEDKRR